MLTGDPAVVFHQHIRLGQEYFSPNWAAWRAPESHEHMPLAIEAGFPLLLWAASQLHERLPFLINTLLLPILVMLLGGVASYSLPASVRQKNYALPLTLVIALGTPAIATPLWALALPFRDTLSHTLGFAALFTLLYNSHRPAEKETKYRWFFIAGLMIAGGGFSRLSGFLFAVPAGGILLCATPALGVRRKIIAIALLAAGVSTGLFAVATQSMLEGRAWFAPPQSEALLLSTTQEATTSDVVRKGWHPGNIPLVLPVLWQRVYTVLPLWMWGLVLAGLGMAAWQWGRQTIRMLPHLAGVLVFLLFYGAYDKVVNRYALVIYLFVALIAAMGLSVWLVMFTSWRQRFSPVRSRAVHAVIYVLLLVAASHFALRSGSDPIRAQKEWAFARQYWAWAQELPNQSTVMIAHHALRILHEYRVSGHDYWSPGFHRTEQPDIRRIQLPESSFFYVYYGPDNDAVPRGWLYDALLNVADLTKDGPPLSPGTISPNQIQAYAVRPRSQRERSIVISDIPQETHSLYLFLRSLPGEHSRIPATLTADPWLDDWTVDLRSGINWLPLPSGFPPTSEPITIRAQVPLPSILRAEWTGSSPIRIRFDDINTIASKLTLFDDVDLQWRGYMHWTRDFGVFNPRHISEPALFLVEGSVLQLPVLRMRQEGSTWLRLYSTASAPSADILPLEQNRYYHVEGEPIPYLAAHHGSPYASRRQRVYQDTMHEIHLPTGTSSPPRLNVATRSNETKTTDQPRQRLWAIDLHWLPHPCPPPQAGIHQPRHRLISATGLGLRSRQWDSDGFGPPEWIGPAFLEFQDALQPRADDPSILWITGGPLYELWEFFFPGRSLNLDHLFVEAQGNLEDVAERLRTQQDLGRSLYTAYAEPDSPLSGGAFAIASALYKMELAWETIPRPSAFANLHMATLAEAMRPHDAIPKTERPQVLLDTPLTIPLSLHAHHSRFYSVVSPVVALSDHGVILSTDKWQWQPPSLLPVDDTGLLVEFRESAHGQRDVDLWRVQLNKQPIEPYTMPLSTTSDLVIWVPPSLLSAGGDAIVNISVDPTQPEPSPFGWGMVRVHAVPTQLPIELDIGSPDDTPWLVTGFHDREQRPDQRQVRWTTEMARIRLFAEEPRTRRLMLHYISNRPSGVPDDDVQVWLNDTALTGSITTADATQPSIWQGDVPADLWQQGENVLVLTCTPWTPADHLATNDRRTLGVQLDRIVLE